ncbi:MAG: sodium ion-translocating decarboxylase subunit beta [Eubacteriales bacterium]|nr:sodium ion-translocating decarboxylase subunit beta [Eubacteriales bacterium]MDD3882324.1 sodium ion-translocating decarboxylase subunit beta [Eubacteriales bacterium]MDD4512070.1 sodium ion-translocating decarboxylase subunit beta [Eubacteriales bacterium]
MVAVACLLLYLAIVKKFEPLLLVPIAFGMLLTNLLGSEVYHEELFAGGHANWSLFGGAVLSSTDSLIGAVNLTINAAGAILNQSGNIVGQLITAVEGAVGFNEVGAIVNSAGEIISEGGKIIMNGAYLSAGQVFTSAGELIASAGTTITPGLLDYLYLGVKLGIYPCLIFMGVGAMTDFGPLIANPKSLLLGAAAQLGIFFTFIGAYWLFGFTPAESGAIGIIGGADGPTAIWLTSKLAPSLLGPIAVAAYSYMALVPVIQPPIMRALTTKKERNIVMEQLRPVSKTQKILFPIIVTMLVALLLPSATSLVGMLMLGNLFKESGVVERLGKTVQNELMNIVTIFLGVTVGATATAETFLKLQTLEIIALGVVAFGVGTAGGVLLAKLMNKISGGKINPLIGSAGVSAVPMAARVSQKVGQEENPGNFLLMHAMGPNVAGVIGSAIAAGVLLSMFGG